LAWVHQYSFAFDRPLPAVSTVRIKRMTEYQTYLGFLFDILQKYNKNDLELSESTGLVADMGLSSLEVMELIEQVEDHFDISIPLNILPDVNTVGDLARRVQELNP